jgi:hypothetical protein
MKEYIKFDQELKIENQALVPWLTTIGLITLMWSPIERSIDQSVHIIYSHLGGKKISKKKPRMLSAKLEFLEKCHKKFSYLNPSHAHIQKLSEVTLKVSQIRDVCVHGWIEGCDNEKIHIGKYAKSDDHITEIFTIDLERLNYSANSMKALAEKWSLIVMELEIYLRKVNPTMFVR